MADFKAFWQRFKSGENGGKGQKDRFMLLALVGLLILVGLDIWHYMQNPENQLPMGNEAVKKKEAA